MNNFIDILKKKVIRMKKIKVVFEIKDDGQGFDLKLKDNKNLKMGYIEGIYKYTQAMVTQYKNACKKENREQRRSKQCQSKKKA